MRKETLVVIIGFVLILLPHIGIPENWKQICVTAFGVLLLGLGYLLLRDRFIAESELGDGQRGREVFVETTGNLFTKD